MLFLIVVASWRFALKFSSWISRHPLDYQKSQKPICDILLSKPRELPTGAFFQSRNSGESVPRRDKWSKRTSRILAAYCLRIQHIRLLGSWTTLGLSSQQTATIASCSIWPHEILAFTTSALPSFYSLYIPAHFQVFTVQSHPILLTALCADAAVWVTLSVSYFHFRLFFSWRRWWGGGRVRCSV